ncbi:universal stress protein [Chloroflexota bacterium]
MGNAKMYKRMLVPLDGSVMAELMLTYARELAGRLDLELILLHVCSPVEQEFVSIHRKYIDFTAETIGRQPKEVRGSTSIQSEGKVVKTHGELVVGHPAEEILHFTEENDIDVILMATHGYSKIRHWALGSVTDKVLRASKVPVWLTPTMIPEAIIYDKWPTRRALVTLDGSELAESTLPHIKALAKQRGADLVEVVLLRVCELTDIQRDYTNMYLDRVEFEEQYMVHCRPTAERYLAAIGERLRDAGLRIQSEILVGEASHKIVDYANNNPINLIIMSTYGHSGHGFWPWGSVADKVLQRSSKPIFLVRPH